MIREARIDWREDGTPYSPEFGDVYHSSDGGPAQAAHVFLGGNQLPQRWQGQPRFTVLETGFGLGTNFFATWHAWQNDPQRSQQLVYAAVELHPPSVADVRRAHATAPWRVQVDELAETWPLPTPGVHALRLAGGRVLLLLGWGDAQYMLDALDVRADAAYLDGFAPARNEQMWNAGVYRALSRRLGEGATLATYTSARAVRDGLTAVGFDVALAPGFGRKRDMTVATRRPGRRAAPRASATPPSRAVVIGAGVAGAAAACALAERGIEVTVVERGPTPASGTSSNRMGALQPLMSRDDNLASRLTRAGFFDALRRLQRIAAIDPNVCQVTGLIHLAESDAEYQQWRMMAEAQAWPPTYAQVLDAERLSRYAGVGVASGGWWFPQGGWLRPASYVRGLLALGGERIRFVGQTPVARLTQAAGAWQVWSEAGALVAEADAVVVAAATESTHWLPEACAMQALRGQVSWVPSPPLVAPNVPVTGDGYVLPADEGVCVVGATYEFDENASPTLRAAAHAENLARIPRLLRQEAPSLDPASLAGKVGWRAVAPDRMPLAGRVHDAAALADHVPGAHVPSLDELTRVPGLAVVAGLGSRGMAWAGIAAEVAAAALCGEACPVERAVRDAIDPARFAWRALRRQA